MFSSWRTTSFHLRLQKLTVTTMSVSEVMIPLSQERHIHPLPSLSYIRSMALVEFLHDQVAHCSVLAATTNEMTLWGKSQPVRTAIL
jgi:hypothetical protein